jgi:hypothetical protein
VASPAKSKLDWPALPELTPATLLLEPIEGLKRLQGTATSFPALSLDDVEEVAEVDDVVDVELDPAEELSESTAKSIRPEAGLITMSLMVPKASP